MKKISIPILSIITGAAATLSLLLRVICLFLFHDDIGYYTKGAALPIIANALLALTLVFILIAAIFSIDKRQSVEPLGRVSQYAALLPMGALIYQVVQIFIGGISDTVLNKFMLAICAIVATAFFFLLSFSGKKYKTLTFYLGISALVYVFLCWMTGYFDFATPINSTDKIFFYLACSGAVIFIFNEMCACYGYVRARFYYFSLLSSVAVLAVSSVSAMIGYTFGIFKTTITLQFDIFFASILIYAVARLIDAQKSKPIIENAEEATRISEEAANNEETQENGTDDSE